MYKPVYVRKHKCEGRGRKRGKGRERRKGLRKEGESNVQRYLLREHKPIIVWYLFIKKVECVQYVCLLTVTTFINMILCCQIFILDN